VKVGPLGPASTSHSDEITQEKERRKGSAVAVGSGINIAELELTSQVRPAGMQA